MALEVQTPLMAAAVAFLVTLVLGYPYLALLRRFGVVKLVRADELASHFGKTGTPTMGGLLFCLTIGLLTLALNATIYHDSGRSILLPVTVLAASALLGAVDDRLSLVGSHGGGLSFRTKFALMGLIGLGAALVLRDHSAGLGVDYLFLPGTHSAITIGWASVPLAALAIMGSAHAVNLTDGLDGLAGHTSAVAFTAFGIVAAIQGQIYLVTFCFIVAGSLLAFLWFNAYPAQVIMGDAGALALGATLAVVALMLGQVVLLPVVGFVYIAVTVSVILQVGYFKATRGRRLFRRAPLHRHFELVGWTQTQVAQRFWLVSMVAALLGVALALL